MGKKTLEDLGKLILMLIITTVINFYTAKRHLKDVVLASKLDKTEYEKDQEKEERERAAALKAHNERHDRENAMYQENMTWIRWYLETTREKK